MARYYRYDGLAPTNLLTIPCPVCGGDEMKLVAKDNGFSIQKCRRKGCGFVYVNPRPDDTQLARWYAEYYSPDDVVPERWQEEMGAIFSECRDFLCRVRATGAVLDVGCSFGHFLMQMEQEGWKTTGVEPSPVAAEYAARHLTGPVHTATFDAIDLPAGSFDAVVSLYVLEHVAAPREFMQKVHDLLRDGGVGIIRIPYTEPLFPLQKLLRRSLMYAPMHLNDFPPRAFERLSKSIGFRRVETHVGHGRRAHDFVENAGARVLGGAGRAVELATRGRALFPFAGAFSYYLYK